MKYFATLGTFDGIHLGHQTIIETVHRLAMEKGAKSALVSFEPYPSEVLSMGKTRRLTTVDEKRLLLDKLGLDKIHIIEFTKDLSGKSPDEFIRMLLKDIDIEGIAVGYNFCFGGKRAGNSVTLQHLGEIYGFDVHVIPPLEFHSHTVSSSRIRNLILRGNIELAHKLLGYPYFIEALVEEGMGTGRSIGFPTINITPPREKVLPKEGVYLGGVMYNDRFYFSLNHIGSAPTTGRRDSLLEAYLIGFDGYLYSERVEVFFLKYIRDIIKFSSLENLKSQIERDLDIADGFIKDDTILEPNLLDKTNKWLKPLRIETEKGFVVVNKHID